MMNIFSAVAGIAGNWVDGKVQETKAKAEVKVEKAKADAAVQKKIATGKIDWEANMADATKGSWKDEFALVVLMLPAILVFIPSLTQQVREGFAVLDTLPQWYQYLLFIAVTSSFGVKGADKLMSMRGKK
jgi:hypothetical protein|tara:strand:- start:1505 stop:1894 length:390 start_codon:yes stop_codon:yes gene_type:complete